MKNALRTSSLCPSQFQLPCQGTLCTEHPRTPWLAPASALAVLLGHPLHREPRDNTNSHLLQLPLSSQVSAYAEHPSTPLPTLSLGSRCSATTSCVESPGTSQLQFCFSSAILPRCPLHGEPQVLPSPQPASPPAALPGQPQCGEPRNILAYTYFSFS